MWLVVFLLTMGMCLGTFILILNKANDKLGMRIIYTFGLFLPTLFFTGFIFSLIFQGGNPNAPIFGITSETLVQLGLFQGDIMIGLQNAPLYGIALFSFGSFIFFLSIVSMFLSICRILFWGLETKQPNPSVRSGKE